ncbi:MAG: NIL domain-containing protein [Candidatus Omnitrophica bacterium]|nr:NIL domain-containing protein [Candidatus Omnitrophota bacterium]MDD5236056.1 NIL domain-containing protein [Candidatus Omnitrophota bacterium]MDD5609930.1 NIL domain-containing protein [Candidatus Omnitrophota bacterium]
MQIAIGLTFPNVLQDEAVLCRVCKQFDVELSIIEASFSSVSGWAILKIAGEEDEIRRTFEYLNGRGIKIQQIEIKR